MSLIQPNKTDQDQSQTTTDPAHIQNRAIHELIGNIRESAKEFRKIHDDIKRAKSKWSDQDLLESCDKEMAASLAVKVKGWEHTLNELKRSENALASSSVKPNADLEKCFSSAASESSSGAGNVYVDEEAMRKSIK